MAVLHGRSMKIKIGTTAVGSVTDWNRNVTCGDVDVTACEDTTKQFLTDLPEGGGSLKCWWVVADGGQVEIEAALMSGAAVDLHIYPDGVTTPTTGHEFFGSVRISGATIGGGVNSAFAVEFTYKGALVYRAIPT